MGPYKTQKGSSSAASGPSQFTKYQTVYNFTDNLYIQETTKIVIKEMTFDKIKRTAHATKHI